MEMLDVVMDLSRRFGPAVLHLLDPGRKLAGDDRSFDDLIDAERRHRLEPSSRRAAAGRVARGGDDDGLRAADEIAIGGDEERRGFYGSGEKDEQTEGGFHCRRLCMSAES